MAVASPVVATPGKEQERTPPSMPAGADGDRWFHTEVPATVERISTTAGGRQPQGRPLNHGVTCRECPGSVRASERWLLGPQACRRHER
ncbi:hypothetical protein GCM10010275_63120 [Streptomyces litmocidini]|nr:hypothetical protein GCM10010275_63120 [Streptomyces litmocidini]